jgi:hypothetical protein
MPLWIYGRHEYSWNEASFTEIIFTSGFLNGDRIQTRRLCGL